MTSYERVKKRMEMIGIECRIVELAEDIEQKEFERAFEKVNDDPSGSWNSSVSSTSRTS